MAHSPLIGEVGVHVRLLTLSYLVKSKEEAEASSELRCEVFEVFLKQLDPNKVDTD